MAAPKLSAFCVDGQDKRTYSLWINFFSIMIDLATITMIQVETSYTGVKLSRL